MRRFIKVLIAFTIIAIFMLPISAVAEDGRDWSTYEQDEKYIVTDDDPTIEEMERQKREAEEADRENPEVIGSEYGGMSPEEWFALLEAAQNSTVIYRDSDADGTPDEGYSPEGNWENVTVPDFVYDPNRNENYMESENTDIPNIEKNSIEDIPEESIIEKDDVNNVPVPDGSTIEENSSNTSNSSSSVWLFVVGIVVLLGGGIVLFVRFKKR